MHIKNCKIACFFKFQTLNKQKTTPFKNNLSFVLLIQFCNFFCNVLRCKSFSKYKTNFKNKFCTEKEKIKDEKKVVLTHSSWDGMNDEKKKKNRNISQVRLSRPSPSIFILRDNWNAVEKKVLRLRLWPSHAEPYAPFMDGNFGNPLVRRVHARPLRAHAPRLCKCKRDVWTSCSWNARFFRFASAADLILLFKLTFQRKMQVMK